MHVLEYERTAEPVRLDAKDRKILACLAQDARMPARTIAKRVLLSPDSVLYRIGRLRERKVLLGTRTVIDVSQLGFQPYHLFLSVHAPLQEETALLRFLERDPRVNAALQFLDRWDYEIALRCRDARELDEFRRDLSRHCRPRSTSTLILINTIKSDVMPGVSRQQAAAGRVPYDVDEADLRILRTIADEADLTYEEVVRRTGLTRDQVRYRTRRMERSGIIAGYLPVINYARLGYGIHAMLLNLESRDEASERRLAELLRRDAAVLWAVRTVGSWDVLLYLVTKSSGELMDAVGRIRPHVHDFELLDAFREYKYTYLPPVRATPRQKE